MLDNMVKNVTVNDDDNTDGGGIIDTCFYFCGVDDFGRLALQIVAIICWPELLFHCTQRRLQLLRKVVITSLLIGGDLRLRCRFSVQHSSWLAS